ncbi:hypothetical protein E2542_SST31511 [Spatholobus suberectus]|nr:hypothetical protein E2542_SST31511 [Spatholobus suberectus]
MSVLATAATGGVVRSTAKRATSAHGSGGDAKALQRRRAVRREGSLCDSEIRLAVMARDGGNSKRFCVTGGGPHARGETMMCMLCSLVVHKQMQRVCVPSIFHSKLVSKSPLCSSRWQDYAFWEQIWQRRDLRWLVGGWQRVDRKEDREKKI